MEWSKDISRLDEEVYRIIVQEKSLKKLKKLFRDARSLVEYSNVSVPYPHKRESVLSLLVQAGSADFFAEVWNHYFWRENVETAELQEAFLKGTTASGQKLNYHYFKEVMPPDVLLEAELFCESNPQKIKLLKQRLKSKDFPPDNRTEEELARWEIYEQIKSHSLRIYNGLAPTSRRIKTDGEKLIEEVSGSNFVWNKCHYPFSEILFKKGEDKEGNVSWGKADGLKTNGDERLLPQVFRKLDFPEHFFWARTSLLRLEEMLKANSEIEYADELLRFFEIKNGIVLIEKGCSHKESNSKEGVVCTAYCGKTNDNRPVLGLVSESMKYEDEISSRKILPHELTHAVEHVSDDLVSTDFFSKTDIMKLSFMALYLRERGKSGKGDIGRVIDEATKTYKSGYYVSETLARIMEPRDFGKDVLVKNLRKLFIRYQRARLNHNRGTVKYIETMAERKLPDYKEMMKLYKQFERFLAVDLKFNEQEFNRFFRKTKIEVPEKEYHKEFDSFYRSYLSVLGRRKDVKLLEKVTSKALKDLDALEGTTQKSKYSVFWRNLFCRSK